MKRILITIGSYFPGYKIGGPAITIKNLIYMFKDRKDLEFFIYCPNHDWAETKPYENIKSDSWVQYDNCKVFYASEKCFNAKFFKSIICDFDVIYCTGAFTPFAIAAGKYAKKHKDKKVIVAPMGSFFKGVLKSKRLKKTLFFAYTKAFNVFRNCIWSVTSIEEKDATESLFGKKAKIVIAEDAISFEDAILVQRQNVDDVLRVVHLSRIHEKKGLLTCINILKMCHSKIIFDVYGTIENESYFNECINRAKTLPSNIIFSYKGTFRPDEVTSIFAKYDVFLFPTFSENFGHVIFESLKSSCVPMISDNTPWSNLQKENCGFVIPLSNLELYATRLDEVAKYKCEELNKMKKACYLFAENKFNNAVKESAYEVFFR